jgi:hypothetical protein
VTERIEPSRRQPPSWLWAGAEGGSDDTPLYRTLAYIDLDALAERISEDMHRWDGTFQMREVGVQEEGFVSVGADDPAKAEPILKEAYGERYLKAGHVEQAQAQVG